MTGDPERCTVCLSDCTEADRVQLPCGHCFHGACAVRWLWTNKSCPNCREAPPQPEAGEERIAVVDFMNSIQRLEQESRLAMQRNMRIARRADAPRELLQSVRLYEKWRRNGREARAKLRAQKVETRRATKALEQEQRQAYRDYKLHHQQITQKHRGHVNEQRQLETRLRRRIRLSQDNALKYSTVIARFGAE